MSAERVCLGVIAAPHGVKGLVKIRPFTEEPEAVAAYGPVTDEAGQRSFEVHVEGQVKGMVLARLTGVADRNAAEALRGVRLYVGRDKLPAPGEEEYYHADLIGLAAQTPSGERLGEVSAVHDFGAGDMLEVRDEAGRARLYPFTKAVVPSVDLDGGTVVIAPPAEV